MPSTLTISTLPLSDGKIIEILSAFAAEAEPESPPTQTSTITWSLLEGNDNNSCSVDRIETQKTLQAVLKRNASFLRRADLAVPVRQGNGTLVIQREADGFMKVSLNLPPSWDSEADKRTDFALAFRNAFASFDRSNLLKDLHPMLADFYNRREATLVRLEELQSKLIVENDQHRRKLEADVERHRQRLDSEHQAASDKLRIEYETEATSLQEKADALAAREKELDDRDNTHARRELQRQLRKDLETRNTAFSLTRDTQMKRRPSMVAFGVLVVAMSALVGLAAYGTTHSAPAGMPFWFPLARLGASLAAFAGSLIFYIRWQDRWSEAHASEEFRLKRLDLDVSRASWLVEVLLEWRREKGTDAPKELIEKLANGLFEQPILGPQLTHPAEDMVAALLRTPAAVKVEMPGGTFSLDRKSMKEMKKANDE